MPDYFSSVAPIVEEAGVALAKGFGKAEAAAFKADHHHSAVTEFDRKTEQFLAEHLGKLFPDIKFFGEEFGGDNSAERFWLVDPIDGTSNFIRGLPFATTMVTLIQDGAPFFSLIYNFISKEMYSAEKGKGARLNGSPIRVSTRPLQYAYIFAETNRRDHKNAEISSRINEKFNVYATRNSGFEYAQVARGGIEARITFGDPPGEDWDYAPGALLVAEAGGVVRNLGCDTYDYRNHEFVAGNREACDALEKLLS